MKVAIVCDWLTGIGGAERVVLELHKLYPDAPIYTSQYDPKAIDWFKNADVRTLWLQRLPKALKKFLPVLRAWAFSRLDLSDYDLVISSSGAEAKAVKTRPSAVHICYCHAPTHYYWSRYEQYLHQPGFGLLDPLARIGLLALVKPMRRWDWQAAQNPDYLVTNSNYTKSQIKKYYGREADIIHPPVDIERFQLKSKADRYGFVTAGRQAPYKRIDLAVAACSQLDVPLKVIGYGPEHNKLVKMAGPRASFLTRLSNQEIPRHFQTAEAFIFPGVDDFGIVAVEALAAGTPVIAFKGGGALEYVKEGKTGLFFDRQTPNSLMQVLQDFDASHFQPATLMKEAEKFSPQKFQQAFAQFVKRVLSKPG